MSGSPIVRILEWLRAGYPDGIPPNDYPPVLGVLRRNLQESDIESIADELALQCVSGGVQPVTADEIRAMVHDQVMQRASAEDIARVSAKLAAGGWPLASDVE